MLVAESPPAKAAEATPELSIVSPVKSSSSHGLGFGITTTRLPFDVSFESIITVISIGKSSAPDGFISVVIAAGANGSGRPR